jgi:excinuclease ABC subunit A
LCPEALAVTVLERSIVSLTIEPVNKLLTWARELLHGTVLNERERQIAIQILKEIVSRLHFLNDVGLGTLPCCALLVR